MSGFCIAYPGYFPFFGWIEKDEDGVFGWAVFFFFSTYTLTTFLYYQFCFHWSWLTRLFVLSSLPRHFSHSLWWPRD